MGNGSTRPPPRPESLRPHRLAVQAIGRAPAQHGRTAGRALDYSARVQTAPLPRAPLSKTMRSSDSIVPTSGASSGGPWKETLSPSTVQVRSSGPPCGWGMVTVPSALICHSCSPPSVATQFQVPTIDTTPSAAGEAVACGPEVHAATATATSAMPRIIGARLMVGPFSRVPGSQL